MKRSLLPLLLFLSSLVFHQRINAQEDSINKVVLKDSILTALKQKQDSLTHVLPPVDTTAIQQSVSNGVEYFERLQKENRNKQRNAAMRNIAIGVVMLVVLVIGLRRKGKK
jgi:hypothetical protein